MIILDTNVLSSLMRESPDEEVLRWLDTQRPESVWLTSITVFESSFGLKLLPEGRRRRALETSFEQLLADDFENRVLDFDAPAARQAALLAARRQRAGRPVDLRDTQMAGIALARKASIATRNLKHFGDLDVAVVNPWATDARR